jgi:hypothetical protein
MNNSSNPAATGTSGGPATTSNEALTARGFFNPMPPPHSVENLQKNGIFPDFLKKEI